MKHYHRLRLQGTERAQKRAQAGRQVARAEGKQEEKGKQRKGAERDEM